jgi:hypothetical protein
MLVEILAEQRIVLDSPSISLGKRKHEGAGDNTPETKR